MARSGGFEALLEAMPSADFAMAYGSGVFAQAGYEHVKEPPMIDLVFGVPDPLRWHEENFARHPDHYAGLGRFGPTTVAFLQEHFGAGMWYNALVPIPESVGAPKTQLMKYGVIATPALVDDLRNWRTLYVSGRMQKPVAILRSTPEVDAANLVNRENALHAALLLTGSPTVTAQEFFITLAGLSYVGDFRMLFGENPNKVRNIVAKNLPGLAAIYWPLLSASPFAHVRQPDPAAVGPHSLIDVDTSVDARAAVVQQLPGWLQHSMAWRQAQDLGIGVSEESVGFEPADRRKLRRRATLSVAAARTTAAEAAQVARFNVAQLNAKAHEKFALARARARDRTRTRREGFDPTLAVSAASRDLPRLPTWAPPTATYASAVHAASSSSSSSSAAAAAPAGQPRSSSPERATSFRGSSSSSSSSSSLTSSSSPSSSSSSSASPFSFGASMRPKAAAGRVMASLSHRVPGRQILARERVASVDLLLLSLRSRTAPACSAHVASLLRPSLARVVGRYARGQSFKGLLSAGVVKSGIYAMQKFEKYGQAVFASWKKA